MKILIPLSLSAMLLLATFFQVDSADNAESSSGSSRKGKQIGKKLTLEEVKAQMRKLYEELALRRQELGIACAEKYNTEVLLPMTRDVEDIERRIVALRPLLCRARGMKNLEHVKKKLSLLVKTIAKFEARQRMDRRSLKALHRYTLPALEREKDKYEEMLPYYGKPELMDGDIVPPGFKVPD